MPPQFPAKLNPHPFIRYHLLFHSRAFRSSVCFPILFKRHIYSRAAGSSYFLLLISFFIDLIQLSPLLPTLALEPPYLTVDLAIKSPILSTSSIRPYGSPRFLLECIPQTEPIYISSTSFFLPTTLPSSCRNFLTTWRLASLAATSRSARKPHSGSSVTAAFAMDTTARSTECWRLTPVRG